MESKLSNELLGAYIAATEISNRGAIWLNPKGIVLGVNKTFAEQVGYGKHDLDGKMIFEINPHLSLMAWRKLWKQLQEAQRVIMDAEHLTANDTLFPVEVRWELVLIEGEKYACGVVEDLIAASRYKDLLNMASEITKVAAWEWDVLHKKFFLTPQFFHLLCLPEDTKIDAENVNTFLSQNLTSQSFKRLETKAINALKSGESFSLELELRPRGNSMINALNLTAKPLFIEDRTVKMYGTIQDLSTISGRTEEMYLANFCMDYGQECVLWVDDKGSVIYANQAAALTYDYTQEAFKTKTVYDFVLDFKENKKDYAEHWQELGEKGMMDYESLHLKQDGTTFPVWNSHNYITYQNKAFNCLFLKDLTDQKIQEDQWRLTQFSIDNAKEMIFWVKADGSFEYVNSKACDILGYDAQEIFAIDPFSISGDFPKKEWSRVWNRLQQEKYLELE
ncbi:MAG: PAS domain S-box protein, partial [Bacteroidota bacterium]